ncbi:uncharacterized protein YdeI (BOF family) [Filimonas zeae]|uniref:Lipocalin-like domain-containing protein n=1 Tax=Filimonas zeae TaxID=1737353 RepID=A0A917MS37_9BACT|nr:hypothetical protein [Filimonas zeae]MDR6337894.1 uncharacterized protein YdeI (BOF family) [Filimonas zeae]GGH60761.1 hypothetical protein GCM10011379_08970 [Filimonas zeae]
MKKYLLLCVMAVITALTSCQKETSIDTYNPNETGNNGGSNGGGNGNGNGSGTDTTKPGNPGNTSSLIGTWIFTGMQAKLVSDMTMSVQGMGTRSVTTTEYTTTDNSGTITFTTDKATTKDIVYSVSTTSKAKIYVTGMETQDYSFPFAYTASASSGSNNYRTVNSDSLYFPGGGLVSVDVPNNTGQNGTYPTQAAGYKYKITGNTLTLSLNTNIKPDMPPMEGVTYNGNNHVNIVMSFKK